MARSKASAPSTVAAPLPDDVLLEDESASGSESDGVTAAGLQKLVELLGDDADGLLSPAEDDEDPSDSSEAEFVDAETTMTALPAAPNGLDADELSAADEEDEDASDDEDDAFDEDEPLEDLEAPLDDGVADDSMSAASVTGLAPNNNAAIERILSKFRIDNLDFFDTLALTHTTVLEIPDAGDDLKRELAFYKQALWAADEAKRRFDAAGKPFKRPDDYFAEMVKSDDHMARVRQKLLDQTAALKASDEAKRQRNLKKFGKKVQVEKRLEREREKRRVADNIRDFRRKRKGEDGADAEEFDVSLLDDGAPPAKRTRLDERGGTAARGRGRGRGGSRMSRTGRDAKFGFGGPKARSKSNTRKSLDAPASRGRGGSRGGARGAKRGGKPQRPGKSKRAAGRGR